MSWTVTEHGRFRLGWELVGCRRKQEGHVVGRPIFVCFVSAPPQRPSDLIMLSILFVAIADFVILVSK